MAIVKDKKRNKFYISYRARVENGNYKTFNIRNKSWNMVGDNKVTITFMKNIELEEIEKDKRKRLLFGNDGNKVNLGQLVDMFYKHLLADNIDNATISNYKSSFRNYLFSIVPSETLSNRAFTLANIDQIKLNLLNTKLKPQTINNKIVAIKKLVEFAKKRKVISRDMADDALDLLEPIKETRNEETDNFFVNGEEDLRKFEESFNEIDQEWYIPIMTMFYGSLRIGEWQALTLSDIKEETNEIIVNKQIDNLGNLKHKTKGREVRFVKLPHPFVAKLVNYAKESKKTENSLLFTNKKGDQVCRNTVRNIISKHCELAHISHITPHGLRHSFATRMFDKGYDVKDVQEHLGHASMETTMQHYIHYTKTKDKDIDDLM